MKTTEIGGTLRNNLSAAKSIHFSKIKGRVHAAIITIRPDEYDAVNSLLADSIPVEGGNNNYEYITIKPDNHKPISVVLTRCVGQGNSIAQSVTNNIISDIDPVWLFLVGIAGGVPDNEFSLGDVVLASALHDFSFGAANEGGKKTFQTIGGAMHPDVIRFLSTKIVGENRKRLIDLAGFATQEKFLTHPDVFEAHLNESNAFYGDADFQDDVRRKLAKRFPNLSRNGGPVVWSGPCANGNLLLKDAELLKKWKESARQVVQVETELGGVYEAARSSGRQNYPVLAIRGLSDIVGLNRNPDWTEYACQTAAALTYAILRSGFIDFSKRLRPQYSARSSDEDSFIRTLNERASFEIIAINHVIKTVENYRSLCLHASSVGAIELVEEFKCFNSEEVLRLVKQLKGLKEELQKLHKKHINAEKQNNRALAHELVRHIHTVEDNVRKLLTEYGEVLERSGAKGWCDSLSEKYMPYD